MKASRVGARRVLDLDPESVKLLLHPLRRRRLDRLAAALHAQECGTSTRSVIPISAGSGGHTRCANYALPTPSRTESIIRCAVALDVARMRRDRSEPPAPLPILADRRDPRSRPSLRAGLTFASTAALYSAASPSILAFRRWVRTRHASDSSASPRRRRREAAQATWPDGADSPTGRASAHSAALRRSRRPPESRAGFRSKTGARTTAGRLDPDRYPRPVPSSASLIAVSACGRTAAGSR